MLKYSSNYSETTGSLWFCSKDEATNFKNDIGVTNNFKSFKHKTKLLRENEADGANGILKSTIAVPLKYFSNFGRSLELINCKVELKLKWTNHWVLPASGNHGDANSNNWA